MDEVTEGKKLSSLDDSAVMVGELGIVITAALAYMEKNEALIEHIYADTKNTFKRYGYEWQQDLVDAIIHEAEVDLQVWNKSMNESVRVVREIIHELSQSDEDIQKFEQLAAKHIEKITEDAS